MTTSRLSRWGQAPGLPALGEISLAETKVAEASLQANAAEAYRLFQRGVAAARGGQRRIAVGLLTRSVQLDHRNEGAWLWLSGVLDEADQIAFCLQAVLKINPYNERARKGLQWLEEQQLLGGKPGGMAPFLQQLRADVQGSKDSQRLSKQPGERWWGNWREWERDKSRLRMLIWSVPILMLLLSLTLNRVFTLAIDQSLAQPTSAPVVLAKTLPMAPTAEPPRMVFVPVLEAQPRLVQEGMALGYLSNLGPVRQQLRTDVENYRNAATGQPGDSLSYLTAAKTFRSAVANALAQVKEFSPPNGLEQAHETYNQGLELEIAAIDDMLNFYGSYKVELANRAALRFQTANEKFEQARVQFDHYAKQLGPLTSVAPQTMH